MSERPKLPDEQVIARLTELDPTAIFAKIWKDFATNRKHGRAGAATKLQRALAEHAAELVPEYATAKEFMSMVFECENYIVNDKQSESGNPLHSMSDWLAGRVELSRIPLEGGGRKN